MTTKSLLSDTRRAELDTAAMELLRLYGVDGPPVPIEKILRRPPGNLWQPDLSDLSLQSFDAHERYAARPTVARLVARYMAQSQWARQRGLVDSSSELTEAEVRYLGRALLMPRDWMMELHATERVPTSVRLRFHVPKPDAAERLSELRLESTGGVQ